MGAWGSSGIGRVRLSDQSQNRNTAIPLRTYIQPHATTGRNVTLRASRILPWDCQTLPCVLSEQDVFSIEGHGVFPHLACSSIMWSCHFFKMKSNSPSGYEWGLCFTSHQQNDWVMPTLSMLDHSRPWASPRFLGKFPLRPSPHKGEDACHTEAVTHRCPGPESEDSRSPCHPSPGSRYMKRRSRWLRVPKHSNYMPVIWVFFRWSPRHCGPGKCHPLCVLIIH